MKLLLSFAAFVALLGAGCSPSITLNQTTTEPIASPSAEIAAESDVVLPIDNDKAPNGYVPVYKRFGEYFSDRFAGYHTGEDAEIPPEDLAPGEVQIIPVQAVADGTVAYVSWVSGYGGVIALQHEIDGEKIQTLYGHLDIASTTLRTGDVVAKGQFLANLGEDKSHDTDGERQHLHFGVYRGTEVNLRGYVSSPAELAAWINPFDFLMDHGAFLPGAAMPDPTEEGWMTSYALSYPVPPNPLDPSPIKGWNYGDLSFDLPQDWDVEYIPSIDALNLYAVSGSGSARERSQILIRHFDANDFQTLSTVDVLTTLEMTVGTDGYDARQYMIEKKAGVADFDDQPSWRNGRHTVTDVRANDGFSRFYVLAANPQLDPVAYQTFLNGVHIIQQ